MKILWVVNIMLPPIAQKLGKQASNREGWLSGVLGRMSENETEFELNIAYPVNEYGIEECTICNGIKCYPFFEDLSHPEYYDDDIESALNKIIKTVNPDLIHIFGTEFPHAYATAKVFDNPQKTVISMQGVCGMIAKDYMALLPKKVYSSVTLRDFLRKDSIRQQQRKFYLRAVSEAAAIGAVNNVIGRTAFDKAAVLTIKDDINYFVVNETMRSSFYEGKWDLRDAAPHTVFLGQGDYPIKGMHFLLEACGKLVDEYPDIRIKIAGNSIINRNGIKDKLKTPAYGKYLRKLITENGLEENIVVLGSISEARMKEEYLSSSLFVLPSYVENSPNTLAEAMLLGMPIVCSDAGGIKDMVSDEEARIFERGNSEQLAACIRGIFTEEDNSSPELLQMCKRAYLRAETEFNPETNYQSLIDVYQTITEKN